MVDWNDANCSRNGIDPELFFPVAKLTRREAEVIHRFCGNCIIQDKCYKFGRETKSIGIWGGIYFGEKK